MIYMVQAMIHIEEETNRILSIVKAKYGLRDKSMAIDLVVKKYKEDSLEPALHPEYTEKLQKISKGKHIFVGSVENLRKRYEK